MSRSPEPLPPIADDWRDTPVWLAPVELVLHAADSCFSEIALKRCAIPGQEPMREAYVFQRGGMFFGVIDFHGPADANQLVMKLRAFPLSPDAPLEPAGAHPPLPFRPRRAAGGLP